MEREKWNIAWPIPITPAFKTKGTRSKVTDAQLLAPLISDRDVKRRAVTQTVLSDLTPSSSPPPPSQASLTQPLADVRVSPILFQVRDQVGEGTPPYGSIASSSDVGSSGKKTGFLASLRDTVAHVFKSLHFAPPVCQPSTGPTPLSLHLQSAQTSFHSSPICI